MQGLRVDQRGQLHEKGSPPVPTGYVSFSFGGGATSFRLVLSLFFVIFFLLVLLEPKPSASVEKSTSRLFLLQARSLNFSPGFGSSLIIALLGMSS